MVKKDSVVKLITGLHARPAANLTKLANTFKSKIYLISIDKKVNAKDIWDILNSGIESGDKVTIICDGEDENKAIEDINTFISNEEVLWLWSIKV